jgi:hypothetical protein
VSRALAVVALLAACSGAPARKPPPDLSGTVEKFAPSTVPLAQALGLSVHLSLSDAAARAGELDGLRMLGTGGVRRDFTWSAIEPRPGQRDWSAQDAAVADSALRGLATLGILDYSAPWANAAGNEYAPPDPDQFAAFAEAAAAHFKGRVAAWEIWNEENLGFRFWQPAEDPAAYASLLAKAYPAVKRGDPQATVVLGGLNWQSLNEPTETFLEDAFTARPDLASFFDAVGLHPYPDYPPQLAPEAATATVRPLGLRLARVRALLDYYGARPRALWVTELGWPVYGSVDEAGQARFTVRACVEALAAGADRVFVYTLDDGPDPTAFPPEDAFGLRRNDGTLKPAFTSLTALIAQDPGGVLVGDDSAGPVRSYRFAGARTWHIRFATDGNTHDVGGVSVGPDPVYN